MAYSTILLSAASAVQGISDSAATMNIDQVKATLGVAGMVGYFAIPSIIVFSSIIVYRHHKLNKKLTKARIEGAGKTKLERTPPSPQIDNITIEIDGKEVEVPVESMALTFDKGGRIVCP